MPPVCRILAAQGIEAEILFARLTGKKIGADSPVFGAFPKSAKNAPKEPRRFISIFIGLHGLLWGHTFFGTTWA
jgi:hypothetical protein